MALNKAQLMDAPGGPGVIGAVKSGTGIQIAPDGTVSINPTQQITKIVAGSNITITPSSGVGEVTISGSAGGVTKIIAGSNISVSPTTGIGDVTISASTGPSGGDIPAGSRLVFYQASAPTGWTQVTSSEINDAAIRMVTSTGGGSGGSNGFTSAFASYTPGGSVSSSGSCTPQGSVSLSGLSISGVSVSGTVGGTTISEGQLASHSHIPGQSTGQFWTDSNGNRRCSVQVNDSSGINLVYGGTNTSSIGGGQSHSHSFSGSASGGSVSGNASFNGSNTSVNVNSNFSGSATSQFAVKYVNMIVCSKN